MALTSKCPNQNCHSSSFELATANVKHSKFDLDFIQCSSCGTVVGVQEFYNTGALLFKLAEKLNVKID